MSSIQQKPKLVLNSTPIRGRDALVKPTQNTTSKLHSQNKENFNHVEQLNAVANNQRSNNNTSPYRMLATQKPVYNNNNNQSKAMNVMMPHQATTSNKLFRPSPAIIPEQPYYNQQQQQDFSTPMMNNRTVQQQQHAVSRTKSPSQSIRNVNMSVPKQRVPTLPEKIPQYACSNHADIVAEYRINIEDECMFYCYDCASHLSNQGFEVEPITETAANNQMISHNPTPPPVRASNHQALDEADQEMQRLHGELQYNQRYQEIVAFLQQMEQLQRNMDQNSVQFREISNHYNDQQKLLEEFYDAAIEHLKRLKLQHINSIKVESREKTQVAMIEVADLQDNFQELQNMIIDMKTNVESIVKDITEDKFRECFTFYHQKVELFSHETERQASILNEITRFSNEDLAARLQDFVTLANQTLGAANYQPGSASAGVQYQSTKNNIPLQQMIEKSLGSQKVAFRHLFQDDQSAGTDQSPQFNNKRI